MSDIILHHYDTSPYAVKIHKILGYKNLAWDSVIIPQVMPKPDLTALTGGYRMTPIMQVGANIYCDSHLIAMQLEAIKPTPSVYNDFDMSTITALEEWGNSLFLPIITVLVAEGGFMDPQYLKDRNKVMPTALDQESAKAMRPTCLGQLQSALHTLEKQLADGRDYLLGDQLSAADLAVNVSTSTLFMLPMFSELLVPCKGVGAWVERMSMIATGQRTEISSADALTVAREASPVVLSGEDNDPSGTRLGDFVRITPAVLGKCPVEGEVVQLTPYEIAIQRHSESLGDVVVHFPRRSMTVERI